MLRAKRQSVQPQGAFKLRPELGFSSFILPTVKADLVTGAPVVLDATGNMGFSYAGQGATFHSVTAGSSATPIADSSTVLSIDQATIVISGKSGGTGFSGVFGIGNCAIGERCGALIPYGTDVYFDFGGATNGVTRLTASGCTFSINDVWVFSTGPRGMEIWQNGFLRASNSATPTRSQRPDLRWGLTSNGSAGGEHGDWYALGCSKKQMPKETCAALSRDLWGTAFVQRRGLIASLAAATRRRIVMWG